MNAEQAGLFKFNKALIGQPELSRSRREDAPYFRSLACQTKSEPPHVGSYTDSESRRLDLRAERALDPVTFAALRRKAILDGCKWDPQVSDTSTLSPFPLVMRLNVWNTLARQAEQLAAEACRAESEILARPELLPELGLPRTLCSVLSLPAPLTPAAGRVIRFDFHFTTEGWRISEANSDVPGGYTEASHFTSLMAEHFPNFQPSGVPGAVWADTLVNVAGPDDVVALLSAPGYMEDHQVVAFVSSQLRLRKCRSYLATPRQLVWRDGVAHLESGWYRGPVACIVRFYQAEWLAKLGRQCEWPRLFRGGKTHVANPGHAVITESKRFPLVWDKLSTSLPTWRALLPETRDPRDAAWERDDGWLLKSALCNTGDTVAIRDLLTSRAWSNVRRAARWFPGGWVAQRRFESAAIQTPAGLRHVCVGIYTINGKACGAYARLAVKPLIDFAAEDAALLLETDE